MNALAAKFNKTSASADKGFRLAASSLSGRDEPLR